MNKKILVLSDSHTPWADLEVYKQAKDFNKSFKADLVISTGDLIDAKAFSRFPKEPEDDGPAVEWSKAVDQCKEIEKLFPEIIILNSNHDRRYLKKASDSGLPRFMLKTLSELVPCKKWNWHLGPNPLIVDNIAFIHGDEYPGQPIAKAQVLGKNLVQGHSHQSIIQYKQVFDRQIWGMDVGCMIDPKGAGFNYASNMLSKVWVGFGYIENNVPHLIPKK